VQDGIEYLVKRRKDMPVVSKNQGVAMNLANAIQKGEVAPKPGTPSAEIAKSMPPGKMGDFTGPIPSGLPKKVSQSGKPQNPPPPTKKKNMRVKNVGAPVKKMRFM
jgi:hypothetical protein